MTDYPSHGPAPAYYRPSSPMTLSRLTAWRLDHYLLVLSIALSPVYLLPSGQLQGTHLVMAALAIRQFARPISLIQPEIVLSVLFLLVAYRVGASIIFWHGPVLQILEPFFLLFGLLTFLAVRRISHRAGSEQALLWGVTLALGIAILVLALQGGVNFRGVVARSSGSFNNPNQLAYFSVLCGSLVGVLHFTARIKGWLLLLLLGATTILVMISLSKGGLIAQYVVLAIITKSWLSKRLGAPLAFSIILVGFVGLGFFMFSGQFEDLSVVRRLRNLGSQGDDSLAARGYFVLAQAGFLEILFGMGPARVQELLGHEVHSTIFSFLGKYGAVGFLLFVFFLADWTKVLIRGLGFWAMSAVHSSWFIYGVAHNGSRAVLFWVLAGASYALAERVIARRGQHSPDGRSTAHA